MALSDLLPTETGRPVVTNGFHKDTESSSLPMQTLQQDSISQYRVVEKPIHTRRPLRIICMGAGYSGLMMGIIFNQKMQENNAEFIIYDRNADLGGTWLENRYPGCQCDIPAHNYAYSFEPNPDWPNYYATSEQIFDYMKKVTAKYDVEKYMKFNHEIKSALWSEEEGKWRLQVQHGSRTFEDSCDIFINAGGILNNWKWPNVEGINDYKGKLMHSAHWDETYDFTNKRVAVIGIGSSGIQIVPKLQPLAKHLTNFIRTQTWISPAPGINEPTDNDPETDESYNFTPEVLEKFHDDPEYLLQHRIALTDRRIDNFKRTIAASETQRKAQELFGRTMRERLGNSEKGKRLAEWLIPKFPVGCRRQTPGPRFLEALIEDNVDVKWDDIGKFTEKGILTKSGEELEFDVICCATGFDTSFRPRIPVIGRNGTSLAKKWEENAPEAYFGITVPEFPNYFMFIGPNSPISNGSLVQGIQMTGIYIYNCIEKLQTESIRSMEISGDACNDFNEHVQEYLKRTVWVGGCRSWYKRGTIDGRVVAIYAGTSFHFLEALRRPRWEDYTFKYIGSGKSKNRFAYLGDGFTPTEARGGSVGATQTLDFESYWKLMVLPKLYD